MANPDSVSVADHMRRLADLRDEVELLRRYIEAARSLDELEPAQPELRESKCTHCVNE